jgi:hypothetical protein
MEQHDMSQLALVPASSHVTEHKKDSTYTCKQHAESHRHIRNMDAKQMPASQPQQGNLQCCLTQAQHSTQRKVIWSVLHHLHSAEQHQLPNRAPRELQHCSSGTRWLDMHFPIGTVACTPPSKSCCAALVRHSSL